MLNKYTVQLVALGIVGSFASSAVANDSALIDALVKKGVLKSKEAEQIRAEAAKEGAHSSGKLKLDESVKSLTLSGDIRTRYNYTSGTERGYRPNGAMNGPHPVSGGQQVSAQAPDKTIQQSFYDLRLRINADYQMSDDFFAGFGLRTAGPSGAEGYRNDNSVLGGGSFGNSGNGFDNLGIAINRAFLGWHATDAITLIAGKQKNPFYTTDLVWDNDINPAGFSQSFDLSKIFGISGFDLSLRSGQFILEDNSENLSHTNDVNRDAFLWQTQLVAAFELGNNAKLTVAPGYLSTNGANNLQEFGGMNVNTVSPYKDAQVLLLPGDISGEVAGVKAKFLWDFAYNFAGKDRNLYFNGLDNSSSGDKIAWLMGLQLGENHKAGDLSAHVNYRHVGAGSVSHQLNDNEFGFGNSLNMSGYEIGVAYNLSDAAYVGVNYLKFERARSADKYKDAGLGFENGEWLQAEVGLKF
jgi:hypothetical protein